MSDFLSKLLELASSVPTLALVGIVLIAGIVKKIVPIIITCVILVVVWIVLQRIGVSLPI